MLIVSLLASFVKLISTLSIKTLIWIPVSLLSNYPLPSPIIKMQLFAALLLAALTTAAPTAYELGDDPALRNDLHLWEELRKDPTAGEEEPTAVLERRQAQGAWTSGQLEQGACKGATFIFCRGTLEPGNMVSSRFKSR